MVQVPEPLLKTKLFIPHQRHEWVARGRLIAQLDAGLGCVLTLLSAPAGMGKTTVLAAWAAYLGRPVAWISLDAADNDPVRFLVYLCAALQTVCPDMGRAAIAALQSPTPPRVEAVLAELINEVAGVPEPLVLVLDDYHAIKARPVHDAVTFLLDHLPPQLHLVIATRTDPPLPLALLRGRRQLAELRAADLRFTAAEAAVLMNQVMGLQLASEEVAALEARTEGWVVGLQLAALSMQGREDVAGFIAAFTGSHHYVLDYLTEEIVRRQPPAVQAFLLHTAPLERLCGPLCDALLDEPGEMDGQAMLEYLERNNLFIVSLDDERCWYRYHHLFADLLRGQLDRLDRELVPTLHRRASRWHEQQGLVAEAMAHALQAGDWEWAAGLFERHSWQWLNRGEMMTVWGWLAALPKEMVHARPWLCIYDAWISAMNGRYQDVQERLQAAQNNLPDSVPGERQDALNHIAAIGAYTAAHQGDAGRAIALGRQALAQPSDRDSSLRSVVHYTLAMVALQTGDVPGACRAFAESGRMAREAGNAHTAVAMIGSLASQQMVLGRLHQAAETVEQALQMATDRDGRPLPLAAGVYCVLSELHYEWNDLPAVACYTAGSVDLARQWSISEIMVRAPLALARLRLAQGDKAGAWQALAEADRFVEQHGVDPWAGGRAEACRVRLWLAPPDEDLESAASWAAARSQTLGDEAVLTYAQERENLALARVLIALGRSDAAQRLLARLRMAAEAGGRTGRTIEALVLEGTAWYLADQIHPATTALERALALAEPEGYVRTFIDEGAPVAALLSEIIQATRGGQPPHRPSAAYVRRLLAAFGIEVGGQRRSVRTVDPSVPVMPAGGQWVEPLTARELEVLRCMADGLSNAETADRLVIAVSTVKQHVNHIFAKLDARSRIQAIVRARELNLLDPL